RHASVRTRRSSVPLEPDHGPGPGSVLHCIGSALVSQKGTRCRAHPAAVLSAALAKNGPAFASLCSGSLSGRYHALAYGVPRVRGRRGEENPERLLAKEPGNLEGRTYPCTHSRGFERGS